MVMRIAGAVLLLVMGSDLVIKLASTHQSFAWIADKYQRIQTSKHQQRGTPMGRDCGSAPRPSRHGSALHAGRQRRSLAPTTVGPRMPRLLQVPVRFGV